MFVFYDNPSASKSRHLPLHKGGFVFIYTYYNISKCIMSIIFNFTLRSVVLDFVIIFINQVAYKDKLVPLVFKAF